MESADNIQLELFSQSGGALKSDSAGGGHFSFSSIRSYEKAILFIFGFAVIGIVAFCLGVERGKGLLLKKKRDCFK